MNPDHLLDQAARLLSPAAGRPRQADLRRAVSACYYALFHHLIDLACQRAAGTGPERADLRNTLARGFSHGEMRDASRSFSGGTLPSQLAGRYAGATVPSKLRQVAAAFVRLQTERHLADYDRGQIFSQTDVADLLVVARRAVRVATEQRSTDLGRLYLLALLTWGKLRR